MPIVLYILFIFDLRGSVRLALLADDVIAAVAGEQTRKGVRAV